MLSVRVSETLCFSLLCVLPSTDTLGLTAGPHNLSLKKLIILWYQLLILVAPHSLMFPTTRGNKPKYFT